MKLPPLNALMVFEVAGRHGSLTKAASELNVTPGAASRQVKRLEASLGIKLFVRSNRQLKFTQDGSHYWAAVNKLFHDLEFETTKLTKTSQAGVLTVRCPRMFLRSWLLPRLPGFYRSNPNVDLRFVVGRAAEEIDSVVDCGIRLGNGNWPDVGADFLLKGGLVPLCAPSYLFNRPRPHSIAELAGHTLLHSSAHPEYWQRWFGEAAQESVLAATRNIYFDGDGLAFQAAIEGLGITLGRPTLVSREIQDNRLMIALPGEERLLDSYYFVYFPQRPKARAFKVFRRWIAREALKVDEVPVSLMATFQQKSEG